MELAADFKAEVASVPAARALVHAALALWHMEDLGDVAALLTSELVANAVLHARTALRLVASCDPPELVVRVYDGCPGAPEAKEIDLTAESGRGLLLVAILATRWGVEPHRTGKTVWFALSSACFTPPE